MRDACSTDGACGIAKADHRGTDIIGAFKESLKKLEWMDEESAAAAAGKVCLLFLLIMLNTLRLAL